MKETPNVLLPSNIECTYLASTIFTVLFMITTIDSLIIGNPHVLTIIWNALIHKTLKRRLKTQNKRGLSLDMNVFQTVGFNRCQIFDEIVHMCRVIDSIYVRLIWEPMYSGQSCCVINGILRETTNSTLSEIHVKYVPTWMIKLIPKVLITRDGVGCRYLH